MEKFLSFFCLVLACLFVPTGTTVYAQDGDSFSEISGFNWNNIYLDDTGNVVPWTSPSYTEEFLSTWKAASNDVAESLILKRPKSTVNLESLGLISWGETYYMSSYEKIYGQTIYEEARRIAPYIKFLPKIDMDFNVGEDRVPGEHYYLTFNYINDDTPYEHILARKETAMWLEYYLEAVQPGMNQQEIALALYDRLMRSWEYRNLMVGDIPPFAGEWGGVFNLPWWSLHHQAGFCELYTQVAQVIYPMAGLASERPIVFNYIGGVGHIWPMLKVDGEWYHLDPTFDGRGTELLAREKHDFFLKTSKFFQQTGVDNAHGGWYTQKEEDLNELKFGISFTETPLEIPFLSTHEIDTEHHKFGEYWYWVATDDKTVMRSRWTDSATQIQTVGILENPIDDPARHSLYTFKNDRIFYYDSQTREIKTARLGETLTDKEVVHTISALDKKPTILYIVDGRLLYKTGFTENVWIDIDERFLGSPATNSDKVSLTRTINVAKMKLAMTLAGTSRGTYSPEARAVFATAIATAEAALLSENYNAESTLRAASSAYSAGENTTALAKIGATSVSFGTKGNLGVTLSNFSDSYEYRVLDSNGNVIIVPTKVEATAEDKSNGFLRVWITPYLNRYYDDGALYVEVRILGDGNTYESSEWFGDPSGYKMNEINFRSNLVDYYKWFDTRKKIAQPTGLTVSSDNSTLSWNAVENAVRYRISFYKNGVQNSYVETTSTSCPLGSGGNDTTGVSVSVTAIPAVPEEYKQGGSEIIHHTCLLNSDEAFVNLDSESAVPALSINATTWSPAATWGEDEEPEKINISVNSTTPWSATTSATWLTIVPASGAGDRDVCIIAKKNGGAARNATITFSAGTVTKTLTVSQARSDVELTAEIIPSLINCEFSALASVKSITLKANAQWTATSPDSWIKISPASGNSDAIMIISAEENKINSPRSSTIKITAGTVEKIITVTQNAQSEDSSAGTLSFSQTAFAANSNTAATFQTTLQSSTTWAASSSAQWLTVSATSGNAGQNELTFSIAPNTTENARGGVVVFYAGTLVKTVSVSQPAAPSTTERWIMSTPDAAQHSFLISYDGDWTAETNAGWLSLSKSYGTGAEILTASVAKRVPLEPLSGSIVIKSESEERIISVSQVGNGTVFINKDSRNSSVSPNGGIASYSVEESAYAWNASTAADWITIVNNTGIEGDSVVYVAKPNTTGATRTATILTTCGSVSAGANNTHTVTQEAGSSGPVAATLDVDTTTWSISSSVADSKMITVTANSAWEISSNADWISFSQTSGTGTGTVTISANANAGTLSRTGTVTISAGEISRTISVSQAGVESADIPPETPTQPMEKPSNRSYNVLSQLIDSVMLPGYDAIREAFATRSFEAKLSPVERWQAGNPYADHVNYRVNVAKVTPWLAPFIYFGRNVTVGYNTADNGTAVRASFSTGTYSELRYSNLMMDVEKELLSYLDCIEPGMSEIELFTAIYDRYLSKVAYSFDYEKANKGFNAHLDSLLSQTAICDEYDLICCALWGMLGLESEGVFGVQEAVALHTWPMIRIEGKWYMTDPTWDGRGTKNGLVKHDSYVANNADNAESHSALWDETARARYDLSSTDYDHMLVAGQSTYFHYYDGFWYYLKNSHQLYRSKWTDNRVTNPQTEEFICNLDFAYNADTVKDKPVSYAYHRDRLYYYNFDNQKIESIKLNNTDKRVIVENTIGGAPGSIAVYGDQIMYKSGVMTTQHYVDLPTDLHTRITDRVYANYDRTMLQLLVSISNMKLDYYLTGEGNLRFPADARNTFKQIVEESETFLENISTKTQTEINTTYNRLRSAYDTYAALQHPITELDKLEIGSDNVDARGRIVPKYPLYNNPANGSEAILYSRLADNTLLQESELMRVNQGSYIHFASYMSDPSKTYVVKHRALGDNINYTDSDWVESTFTVGSQENPASNQGFFASEALNKWIGVGNFPDYAGNNYYSIRNHVDKPTNIQLANGVLRFDGVSITNAYNELYAQVQKSKYNWLEYLAPYSESERWSKFYNNVVIRYRVRIYRDNKPAGFEMTSTTTLDVSKYLSEKGVYTFGVTAIPDVPQPLNWTFEEGYPTAAMYTNYLASEEVVSTGLSIAAQALSAPENPTLSNTVARWTTTANPLSVKLQLYKDNIAVGDAVTLIGTQLSHDFAALMTEPGVYHFTIQLLGDQKLTTDSVVATSNAVQYPTPEPENITLSQTSWDISSSAADSKMITITANSAWEISSNADWISFSQTSGTGTGTVTISANANAGTLARTGTVTISAGEISRTISVSQAGVEEVSDAPIATYISLGTSSYDFTSATAQSKGNNAVWSDGTWIATSNNEWLTISLNTESIGRTSITSTKTESIKFYVTENTGAARTGTITITMPNSSVPSRIITITQVAGAIIPEPPEEEAGIDRWVYGITPPTLSKSANGDYAIWSEGCGWYDADKVSLTADVGNDSNLCWAATCANLLHWWFDRNAENITRYGKYTGPENTYRNCFPTQTPATAAVNMSSFFDWYKNNGYGNSGNNVRVGIEHFLSVKPGSISGNERNGAYLADVFPPDDTNYFVEYVSNAGNTQSTAGMSPELLASTMKRVFAGKIAVGMSYQIKGAGHAVTVWGARFDAENNYVTHLFVADNNADYDGGDLNATKIIVSDGMVYLGSTNFKINYLSLLRTGDEEWATYFNDFDSYNSWAEEKGLTGTNAELDATPAKDGIANLEKFVFDATGTLDPTKPAGAFGTTGIVSENDEDFLQLEFPYNPDAEAVELSAERFDGTAWTSTGTLVTRDDANKKIFVKLTTPISTETPKQAVRLTGTLGEIAFTTEVYGCELISVPASTTTKFALRVHKPFIFQKEISTGTNPLPFSVGEEIDADKVTIFDSDLPAKIDSAKSYIVEILTAGEPAGTRVSAPFIVNRSAWRGLSETTKSAGTVTFVSANLADYLSVPANANAIVGYKIREASTLSDVVGAPAESALLAGTVRSADVVKFHILDKNLWSFWVSSLNVFDAGSLNGDGVVCGNAPIFYHRPIQILRRAPSEISYILTGEVLTDSQEIRVYKSDLNFVSGLLFDAGEAPEKPLLDSEIQIDSDL